MSRFSKKGLKKLVDIHIGSQNPLAKLTPEQKEAHLKRNIGDNNPARRFPVALLRKQHDNEIDKKAKELKEQGYTVVPIGRWNIPIPDIIAFKDGLIIAYELSSHSPEYHKYSGSNMYDEVNWIRFKKDKSCAGFVFGARLKKDDKNDS